MPTPTPNSAQASANSADHIAVSIFVRAVLDTVFCINTGPQTKAIMVFGGQDGDLEPGFSNGSDPLARIQFGRVENGGSSLPFPHSLSVKVFTVKWKKAASSLLLPVQLLGCGSNVRGGKIFSRCWSGVFILNLLWRFSIIRCRIMIPPIEAGNRSDWHCFHW